MSKKSREKKQKRQMKRDMYFTPTAEEINKIVNECLSDLNPLPDDLKNVKMLRKPESIHLQIIKQRNALNQALIKSIEVAESAYFDALAELGFATEKTIQLKTQISDLKEIISVQQSRMSNLSAELESLKQVYNNKSNVIKN